jgi:NADPH:quinone reductase-like Zn-dependent oxidoreductase
MTAVVRRRYGPADVLALEEIHRPIVGDRDVLLRVHAVGLNAVWSIAGAPGLAARHLAAAVGCPRVDWSGPPQLARQTAGDLPLAHPT